MRRSAWAARTRRIKPRSRSTIIGICIACIARIQICRPRTSASRSSPRKTTTNFSDDCHADFANYTDGREVEQETPRRLAADQAWFEYMPVDFSQPPTSDFDASKNFPDQLRYYRNFVFGQHFELVMTDLRRYRPDHLIPEDAFPGSVFLEQAALTALEGTLPDDAAPYVDIATFQGGALSNRVAERSRRAQHPSQQCSGPDQRALHQ